MKPLRLQSAIISFVLLLGICGCSQRKPPVLIAPQQVPTTVPPEPTPTPEQPGTPADQQPAESAQQPGAATDQTPAAAKAKSKSTRRATKKPAGTEKSGEVAKSTPTKIVVPADKSNPPQTSGGQISPGPTPTDNNSQASTEQLLQSAENNLNSIKRQLSKDEEVMQAQIREFIKQSHNAITENDLARAHILAVKARLLSDELVKHQ
jgi:hypothetical protein